MTFVTFFSSLILVANWVSEIWYRLCLAIDGLIYFLVSYSYNLFLLMCQINFNSLYAIVAPLIDRLEAVVMVFVVFKLGIALIQYLIEPDKAPKEGTKIVKNIFITAILLISYNFVFSVFNELSMLIIGVPEGYNFTTLSQIAGVTDGADEGLIMRFVFGEGSEVDDIGDYIAYQTVSMFVRNTTSEKTVEKAISTDEGDYDFRKLSDLSTKIGKSVDYTPMLSGLIGLYLIYSIVKIAIEIGIRMFKILILQIMAPIAIITVIEGGVGAGIFKKYCSTYFSVFISAFVRILSMLIITVFVCKFFINFKSFFSSTFGDEFGFDQVLILIVVVVAGFQFMNQAPKFIDDILGTHMADAKGGIGSLLGSALGFAAGGIAGGISGLATGIANKNTLGGVIGNTFAGMGTGAVAGAKGNKISDKVKNLSAAGKKNASRAEQFGQRGFGAVVGGGIGTALGLKTRQDQQMYKYDQQQQALSAYEAAQKEEIKDYKVGNTDDGFSWGTITGADGAIHSNSELYNDGYDEIKLGEDKDSFASKMIEFDKSYVSSKAYYEAAVKSGDDRLISEATSELASSKQLALKRAGDVYDHNKNSAHGDNVQAKESDLVGTKAPIVRRNDGSVNAKETGKTITRNKHALENTKSYSNTHGAPKK